MATDDPVPLDPKTLARGGIGEAYSEVVPRLKELIPEPAAVVELANKKHTEYRVRAGGVTYAVAAEDLAPEGIEDRAVAAFFALINAQLAGTGRLLYQVGSGRDLGAVLLTEDEAAAPGPGPRPSRPAAAVMLS